MYLRRIDWERTVAKDSSDGRTRMTIPHCPMMITLEKLLEIDANITYMRVSIAIMTSHQRWSTGLFQSDDTRYMKIYSMIYLYMTLSHRVLRLRCRRPIQWR